MNGKLSPEKTEGRVLDDNEFWNKVKQIKPTSYQDFSDYRDNSFRGEILTMKP